MGSIEAAKAYSIADILYDKGTSLTLPPGYVDIGSRDELLDDLLIPNLIRALNENGHNNFPVNYIEGYDHSYFFVNEVIEDHIDFHATHLYR